MSKTVSTGDGIVKNIYCVRFSFFCLVWLLPALTRGGRVLIALACLGPAAYNPTAM